MRIKYRHEEDQSDVVGLVITRKGETATVKAVGTENGMRHNFPLFNGQGPTAQVMKNVNRWQAESGVDVTIVDET
jgi:hypothetical protein